MPGPSQLIVGLGNPGPAYRETRHNVGHRVVDALAARLQGSFATCGPAALAEASWPGGHLVLAKPAAYMNVVGEAVGQLLRTLELASDALIVVYDDLDLPFGRVRVRHRGRAGGHNGVRSLIAALGTDAFRRVKVGIGRPATRAEVVDWVLTPFSPEERLVLPDVLERAATAALGLAAAGRDLERPRPGPGGGCA